MKIVFLDIDGVLQPARSRKRFEHINEIEEVASRLEARNPDYEYRAYVTAEQGPHGTPYSRNIRRYNLAAVYFDWSKSAVAYFTDILQKSDAKIVISSDWRDEGEYAIKLFLSVYGLDKYYYGLVDASYYVSVGDRYIKRDFPRQKQAEKYFQSIRPEGVYFDSRASEIRDYLDQHPEVTSYVAIDDRNLGFPVDGHFVHVRHGELKAEDCELAKKLLQQEDGPYPLPREIFKTPENS